MPGGIRFTVKEIDRGWNILRRTARTISERNSYVKVGVFDATSPREGKMSNAKLAAIHEFGAPSRHIPERSFIRATIREKEGALILFLKPLIVAIYEQKIEVAKVLDLLGLKAATLIKRRITSGTGIPPPNAPSTILAKLKKGLWNKRTHKKAADLFFKISAGLGMRKGQIATDESKGVAKSAIAESGSFVRPLIDTGRMLAAITWQVVMRKGRGDGFQTSATSKVVPR